MNRPELEELIRVVRRQAVHRAAWSRQFQQGGEHNLKTLAGLIVEDEKLIQAVLAKEQTNGS